MPPRFAVSNRVHHNAGTTSCHPNPQDAKDIAQHASQQSSWKHNVHSRLYRPTPFASWKAASMTCAWQALGAKERTSRRNLANEKPYTEKHNKNNKNPATERCSCATLRQNHKKLINIRKNYKNYKNYETLRS